MDDFHETSRLIAARATGRRIMNRERSYNMLRGCVLASGLEKEDKRELCDFITELESHEDYMEEDSDAENPNLTE